MPRMTRTAKTITIELDSEIDAQHVQAALDSRQWVRMKDGNVVIARPDPEPTMSEHDRLVAGSAAPCFPPNDNARMTLRMPAEPGKESWSPGCYVKHLGAYQRENHYERWYKLMISIGFSLLRSPRGPDNKIWEVWYLPGMFALEGQLKGADRQTLVKWLFHNVFPGNVSFDGEAWAMSVE